MAVAACCLLAAFLGTTVVEAAAGVEGEVAAGRAPLDLEGDEENSLTFTFVPGAALRLRSMTDTLTLTYTPRIFYRVPNLLDVNRPLLLHQMTLDHSDKVSRRLTWNSTLSASVGEVDYTASNLVFNTATSAVRTSVTDIIRLEGQTGFQYELSRQLRWTWDANADYTRPLGDATFAPPVGMDGTPVDIGNLPLGGVPESAQASTISGLSYAVTRADRVGLSGEITYQWFPDTGRFLLLSPSLFWEKQMSRRTDIGVAAGIAYVVTVETLDGRNQDNSIGGTGSLSYDSVVYRARSAVMSLGLAASLDWFFDPLAGTSQPRAGIDANSNIQVGRDWQITPNASFYTLLRESRSAPAPRADDGTINIVSLDATQLRGEIPCSYRLSDLAYVNFGVRGSLRGRSLLDEEFSLTELVEFWAFAGFTLRFASGRDTGNWLSM